MTTDHIRYDLLAQEALRGVVRKVLQDVAKNGLPGDHHFYISFRTHSPGVRISQRLKDKYPDEMTIVLQYQFWDLTITDQTFEVGLSFGGVPERLLIPFEALTGFFDPSVQFGLRFEEAEEANENEGPDNGTTLEDELHEEAANTSTKKTKGSKSKKGSRTENKSDESDGPEDPEPTTPSGAGGAEIVRLDRFRKKT
jgi:uncharacterized protein